MDLDSWRKASKFSFPHSISLKEEGAVRGRKAARYDSDRKKSRSRMTAHNLLGKLISQDQGLVEYPSLKRRLSPY